MIWPSLMMVLAVLLVSAILVRRPASMVQIPPGRRRWSYRFAIAVLALYVLVWAAMGIGEMAAGIEGGEGHLFPAAAAAFLAFLGWRRPDAAATVLLVLGTALTLFLLWVLLDGWRPMVWWYVPLGLLLFGGPFLLAGFLLRFASGREAGDPRERPT